MISDPSRAVSRNRRSGILLHISSLTSPWGTGDLGPGADSFVDLLSESGQALWQVLPLSPTDPGQGSSPYSGLSAFAGNPLFISPEILSEAGLLDASGLKPPSDLPPWRADFLRSAHLREPLFRKAFSSFSSRGGEPGFTAFRRSNAFWLDDHALFSALKERLGSSPWFDWPGSLRDREKSTLEEAQKSLEGEIAYHSFLQYMFYLQWQRVRGLCSRRGIALMGDIPVYVSLDSCDVWADRSLFDLDGEGRPRNVAGVPPDYFSLDGQRWGNPVYRWNILEAEGFGWWIRRLSHALSMFDFVRIDHFRGLIRYWSIPDGEKTALKGHWRDAAPGAFFPKIREVFHDMPFIAENLGVITPDVTAWLEKLGIPGMLVLQFAFGDDFRKSPYSPQNHVENACVYTGTHDNNTSRGWFETEASPAAKRQLSALAGHHVRPETVSMDMISLALASKARFALFPMQDLLGLGGDARLNTPGTSSGNWLWRMKQGDLEKACASSLASLSASHARMPGFEADDAS